MREVTQTEFYTVLYADKRDIMPTIVSGYPYRSEWKDRDGRLFGVSQAGGTNEPTAYFLVR